MSKTTGTLQTTYSRRKQNRQTDRKQCMTMDSIVAYTEDELDAFKDDMPFENIKKVRLPLFAAYSRGTWQSTWQRLNLRWFLGIYDSYRSLLKTHFCKGKHYAIS